MELEISVINKIAPINPYQANNTFLKHSQHLQNAYSEQQITIGESFSKILYDIEIGNDK